jgi:hypothetical protein
MDAPGWQSKKPRHRRFEKSRHLGRRSFAHRQMLCLAASLLLSA